MRFGPKYQGRACRSGPIAGIRLCGDEFHPDGLSHEMKQIAKYYDDNGIDFIGVVGSG